MSIDEYDYIIVGAGSAGCVLANRLSADGKFTVCVVEYGGSDRSVFIRMPSALSIPMNLDKYTWLYRSEPEPNLGGRRITCPRGKVLGGSSSINGLVYIRGNPADFDGWAAAGATGWDYQSVLPYFKKAESRHEGGNQFRGDSGPLGTRYGRLKNPLYTAFVAAANQAGHPLSDDINGKQQQGFGRMDMTVRDGVRCSAAVAYLHPASKRPNLTILTRALVSRIDFKGKKAIGITYRRNGSENDSVSLRARREVILAAGSINSPKILKLSGVGNGEELKLHDIKVVHHLPGVGENLQDHLEYYHQFASKRPITLYTAQSWWRKGLIGAQWLLTKRGLGATNHFETCGFVKSSPKVAYADIQYHFLPLAVTYDGKGLASEHGFQVHVGSMRSKSRGTVKLASRHPGDDPLIRFNYMSHKDDWKEMRACVRLTRAIFDQPAMAEYRGREIQPGDGVTSDAEIDGFLREKLESAYHPSCSNRMGAADDPLAVVDPQGRVIGLTGLRIVDSSIMPLITTGNLNAPTIMLAEKLSDDILRGRR